jgi:hypothetical protein
MNKQMYARVVMALAIVLGSRVATASTIIYDNGVPCNCASPGSDLSLDPGFGAWQSADDFVLSSGAAAIIDIHWWGFYHDGNSTAPGTGDFLAADAFTVRFFADAGGVPAASSFAEINPGSVTRSPYPIGSVSVFQYDADIAAVALTPGVTYWLSIVNNTAGDPDDWYWQTATLFGGGNYASRFGSEAWLSQTQGLAFNLTGPDVSAVPEPGTLLLLATGAAGLVARRRRR